MHIYDTYVTNILPEHIFDAWEDEIDVKDGENQNSEVLTPKASCLFDIFVAKPSGLSFDDTRIKFSKSY